MPNGRKETLDLGFAGERKRVDVELPNGEPRPWDGSSKLTVVGQPVARIDGPLKVSGAAKYTFDISLPGLLHAVVLRSPYPCAVVESIDLGECERQAGVKAVLALAKPGDRLLFAGQDVAAIAAERPELAQDAVRHAKVRYRPEPFVIDTLSATKNDAPVVHTTVVRERKTEGDEPGAANKAKTTGNVRPGKSMQQGDVTKGFKTAQVVHEATYVTQVQTHSALETHGIVIRWDAANKLTVWCSTQAIFSVRDELAEIFELDAKNVHVITHFVGGGFGAKFGASAPGSRLGFIAGELARKANAPVKLMLDRKEEHTCTGNRPDSHQQVKIGATKDGKLTAIHVVAHGSAGVGTGAGVGRNAFAIYAGCPNILVESTDVFTHGGPGTAMRAPGHPQGAFAIESAIDELAAKLGRDPIDIRLAHDRHPVRRHQLQLGRERFHWTERRREAEAARKHNTRMRTGVGVASSIWGDFGRPRVAVATVSIHRDGTIEVKNGVQDIGTGIATVLAQVVAEVFQRPLASVRMRYGDSEFGPSVGSGGSQTTASVSPAVRNAAETAKAQLGELAARLLGTSPNEIVWNGHGTVSAAGKSLSFIDLCKKIDGEAIVATATRPDTYSSHPMKFMNQNQYQIAGVQFAEVEVDTWTGIVRATKVLAIHDCGKVMNEHTLESQINGGVILGASYALMEQRVMDRETGLMLNANLEQYKILGAKDTPEITIVITPVDVGGNSTGAIGIGEPATIPTAAAIANAVGNALGTHVRTLPITPDKILATLQPGSGASGGA